MTVFYFIDCRKENIQEGFSHPVVLLQELQAEIFPKG
jgi:hypothetical protein